MRKSLWIMLAIMLVAIATPNAYADVIFETGNHPQLDEQNILFSMDESGSTVTGMTNMSGTVVDFSSTTDTLMATASGQAKVTASDGLVNDISITSPGNVFSDLIINPVATGSGGTAEVTVQATDGIFTFSYALGNGNNFLTIITTAGETISSVTVDDTVGFEDLKQPRISGLSAIAVPEPSSVALMLAGIGLLLVMRKRIGQRLPQTS
jgi:hypothetical protein